MRPICRNCEYFDCEGKDPNTLPLEYRGDCLNPKAPGFQSSPEEFCSSFYPDSIRWPKKCSLTTPQGT